MADADSTTPTVPPVPPAELPASWVAYITPFATAIGKSVRDTTEALKSLVGEPGDDAIEALQNEKFATFEDVKTAVGAGVPVAKLRKAVAGLRKAAAPTPAPSMSSVAVFDVLPQVPADSSWLESLRTGGVLKFNRDTVIGIVSAALAKKVGLYDLSAKICEAMESQAEALEGPVPEEYLKIRHEMTRRNYAEIFAAIPGGIGQYATQTRKNQLLQKTDQLLWVSLTSFQSQLKQWLESWQSGMANPAMMMGALAALAGGGSMMPPGMMQPPPTDALRASAESVITGVNRIFAGTGSIVAMALAYDAQQIRNVLENPSLPAYVGAANRELMLRQLGVAVTSDYPRLERSLKQYVLGVVELPNVTAGPTEIAYVTALFQLGAQIPWDKLTGRVNTEDEVTTPERKMREARRF